jgi:hypothetical protein
VTLRHRTCTEEEEEEEEDEEETTPLVQKACSSLCISFSEKK